MATLCFYRGTGFVSRMIRWFSRGRWSHVAIRYYDPVFETDLVVSADAGGIMVKRFRGCALELNSPMPLDERAGFRALVSTLGTPYDYASFVGRLWVYTRRWMGIKVRNPLGNPDRDVCCESAIRFLAAAGVDGLGDTETSTPEGVCRALERAGWRA